MQAPHDETPHPEEPARPVPIGTALRGLRLVGWLELGQDIVIVAMVFVLYVLMGRQLVGMWQHVRAGLDLRAILTDILFLLILVELFRLLIYYLRERHVAVGTMVEVGIIGVLREVILVGPLEIPWPKLLAVSGLLLTLGALLRFARLRRGRLPAAARSQPPRPGG
ncbi:MAG TPA: phosphate-starvation-inducible PsiE family protein, partial [Thermodesulfobacteriota bacterium]|nr:phosphate-starvation-inducible PsiE family protein [Thermodesulfobacteriota bacterium]